MIECGGLVLALQSGDRSTLHPAQLLGHVLVHSLDVVLNTSELVVKLHLDLEGKGRGVSPHRSGQRLAPV